MECIHNMNLRNLDLNLLLVFEAVFSERSITKAANKLALSQPAVSNALNRLRDTLNDPLFEREGKGIAPTDEARRLAPVIGKALKAIEKSLEEAGDFSPEDSVMEFKIIMSDAVEPVLMPALIRHAAQNCPGISFALQPMDPEKLRARILAKEVHLGLFVIPINEDKIRSSHLLSTQTCIIARADHPVIGHKDTITEDDFFSLQWVLIGDSLRRASSFHQEAKAKGRSRRIVCKASRMLSLPYIVADTDLIGVVTSNIAERFADQLGLKIFKVPFKTPPESWHMIWHDDYTDDPAHAWLRNQLKTIVS